MSWISLEDEVRALLFAIMHTDLSGPVNLTGPAPVTNAEFTTAFGRAVNRPTAADRCPVSRCAPRSASSPTRGC